MMPHTPAPWSEHGKGDRSSGMLFGPKGNVFVHASDCPTNNGPAFPPGPCNCGIDTATPDTRIDLIPAPHYALERAVIEAARNCIVPGVAWIERWNVLEAALAALDAAERGR